MLFFFSHVGSKNLRSLYFVFVSKLKLFYLEILLSGLNLTFDSITFVLFFNQKEFI